MKKNHLKQITFMGIFSGIVVASSLFGEERGFSNQGYFYNQDQNQGYYYQQGRRDSSKIERSTKENTWIRSDQNARYDQQQYRNQNDFYEDNNSPHGE